MRTTTAYFAGVATVAVAIAAGLGGGLLFANIVAPHESKYGAEPTRLEQRMAVRSIPMTPAASDQGAQTSGAQPQTSAPAVASGPAEPTAQRPAASPPADHSVGIPVVAEAPTTPAPALAPVTREPVVSPREAYAKARDTDLKQAAVERRRAERRQRLADRRRDRQPREQELEAVELSVREATEPRQAFMAEPVRLEGPRIRLFGE